MDPPRRMKAWAPPLASCNPAARVNSLTERLNLTVNGHSFYFYGNGRQVQELCL